LNAIFDLENHPRFPTIPHHCCAEVVLGIRIFAANKIP